jgi:predicted transcriptional regulator
MLYAPSLLWRRYPKSDLCHQNRYLKYCEFCESSHADRKIVALDLAFYLPGQFDRTRGAVLARREPKGGKPSGVIPLWSSYFGISILPGMVNLSSNKERAEMPEEPPSASINRELAAKIAAVFVRRNQIGSDQLAPLISTVHRALAVLGKSAAEANGKRTPAVPIRRSVHRDYVVCLECGSRSQMLKRHLATGHGLIVEQCRARRNLSREHPLTAPGYSERRSSLAKQIGLGRLGRGSRTTAAPKTPTPRRRPGRPRTPRS